MDLIDRARAALRADPRLVVAITVAAAVVYYVLVVAGEIGRTGSIVVTAIPAALVLVSFLPRPLLAIGLSTAGILAVAWAMTNGFYVQDVTQQSAAGVAIFGAARSSDPRVRRIGIVFTAFVSVVATVFVASRWYWGAGAGPVLILPFVVLVAGPWVLARAMRDLGTVAVQLETSEERNAVVQRDVIIEQERNRVARDVHDVVAHSLAVVIAQADGARYAAEQDPKSVGPALDAISDTARTALGEVRTLLHELRHTQSATPAPGSGDVDALIDGFRALGLTVEVSTYGHQRALGDATQLALYRVVQESLTNALRHGDVTQPVTVDFDWGDHTLAVVVTSALLDDGVPQIDGPGHGLPGMRERAALAGGDFAVGIGTKGRFRVRASLPATTAPDAPTSVLRRA